MEICGGHGDGARHYRRPGLDVWIRSRVKQDIAAGGGDLNLISSCASGRITRLVMADICGFGPLFKDLADRLRQVMKRNANTIRQARSVSQMSAQLAAAARQGGFASTVMSTYFAPTRSLTVCNAGHPPPMLYRRRSREWSLLKQQSNQRGTEDNTLGVVSADEYQHTKTTLETGDMVLAVSNSLTETRAANGQLNSIKALLKRVRQLDCESPGDLSEQLIECVCNEHVDNLRDVDASIVLCRATETRVAWRDNLLAPFRLLRSVSDRTSIA